MVEAAAVAEGEGEWNNKQWVAVALIVLTMIVMSQLMSGNGKKTKSAPAKSPEQKPQGSLVTFRGKLTK
jgi:hypothetical protein